MSGGKADFYDHLLSMNSDDVFNLIEELPDDNISELGDSSDDDMVDKSLAQPSNTNIFETLPIVFADDNGNYSENGNNENLEWDSEDELPLFQIRAQEIAKKTIWTKSATNCLHILNEFNEMSGSTVDDTVETPTDMFLHIFPESLISHVVFQTNLYAIQKTGGNERSFVPTNLKEIKVFIAINLIMGIKKLPSYKDYWSSKPELRDTFISSLMPRDRFTWLLAHVHINDNSLQPSRDSDRFDKLYKLRPLLDKLTETFLSSLKPSQNQAIDESMIRFKGRSYLKQYMPNKPIKRGYKVWIRADESGYVCEFQIYTGKVSDIAEKNLGLRVVVDLTRSLIGKGHHLYFDNFFNSIELQKKLQTEHIYSSGTVRKNRKDLPKDLASDKVLKRGDSDWRVSTDGMVCLKWMDNRPVYFLSNYMDPTNMETTKRKKKDGTNEEVACSVIVGKYNKHMGYVDKMDMLKTLYEVDRKSKKWWHRIFFYFIDLSIVNAFILYKKRTDSPAQLNLKQFRLSVALGLIGAEGISNKRGRPSSAPINHFKRTIPYEVRYDSCAHMPRHVDKQRRCAFCSSKTEPHKSRWVCTRCDVGLCLSDKRNCFAEFHKK